MVKNRKNTLAFLLLLCFASLFLFNNTLPMVQGEILAPITEDFTTTTYMDSPATNVSGWGTGTIENSYQVIKEIGSYDTNGNAIEIYIHGDIALVGTENSLDVLDIKDPTNPHLLDTISTNIIRSICVDGDIAYLATSEAGLKIVDISDPANIVELTTYDTVSAYDVDIFENYAFISDGNAGIKILDVSNPSSPGALYVYDSIFTADSLSIRGVNAYVSNSSSLVILNIADPTAVYFVKEIEGFDEINSIFLEGSNTFLAAKSGLHIINSIIGVTSTLVSSFTDLELNDVMVNGEIAYVTDYHGYVYILDLKNKYDIQIIGSYEFSHTSIALALYFDGTEIYTANYDDGIRIIKVTENVKPSREKLFNIDQTHRGICAVGDVAYIVGNHFTGLKYQGILRTYNISDPENVVLLGEAVLNPGLLDFGHIFYDVEVFGSVAYVFGTYMMYASGSWVFKLAFYGFDILDSANPTYFGAQVVPLPLDFYAWWNLADFDIEVNSENLYLTCGSEGVAIYDMSTPLSPAFDNLYDDFHYAADIKIEGNNAFVASGEDGLKIVDISNPSSPTTIGWYDSSGVSFEVWIEGDLAYIADGENGLVIVDISDPTSPTFRSQCNTNDLANGIIVSGNTAFVNDADAGIAVIDVTNPDNPQLLYSYSTPGNVRDSVVRGDYCYLVEHTSNIEVVNIRKNVLSLYNEVCQAQSKTFYEGTSSISINYITLTESSVIPGDSQILYYISADGGIHWEAINDGVKHQLSHEGRNIKWKAVLETQDSLITPSISSITLLIETVIASPDLLSPVDGLVTDEKRPTFSWSPVEEAYQYLFQLDDSSSFISPIINVIIPSSETFYKPGTSLAVGTYYWRVAAIDNGNQTGPFSEAREIFIELDISSPEINSPDDISYLLGATGNNITWEVFDILPKSYNITFNGIIEDEGVWNIGENEISISIDGLAEGTYTYVCYVYDLSNQWSSDEVMVTVTTTQPPIIDSISDFSYEEGTAGHSITWHPTDDNPVWFNITRNGELIDEGEWAGSTITIDVDNLTTGTYTFICSVYDEDGNKASNSIIVTVVEPIVPTIDNPADVSYEVGSTGHSITWHPYDNNPKSYSVTRNGVEVDSGAWSGESITVNIDDLAYGNYEYICHVYDDNDDSAADTVHVTVEDTIAPTIDNPGDISYIKGETGYSITWNPFDYSPSTYTITMNDTVVETETWTGEEIIFSVDGLESGTYLYECTVYDAAGNSISDTVKVTVAPIEEETTESNMFWFTTIIAIVFLVIIIKKRRK